MAEKITGPRPSDRFIPYYFVIFFVALAGLLFWFVDIAVKTNTGVITENAYNKGLAYNKIISAADEQEKLGWKGEINLNARRISFKLTDKSNNPISNAHVTAFFLRPTSSGHDKQIDLVPDYNGNYTADIDLELKGLWDVTILATYKENNYQKSKRLIVE